ncbi:cytochrome P450 [Halalkalibacter hemicellulosilyticus]|uniref:Putative cytochrome P450 hydroxylase n=1 Tax=Halalkalibacter hemicellulosilyticusJCM 9152 TaxID=1236971 RepID=W4QL72_9BACI|nr:putative cytochrome P450 hydroxylase [Halalkalibacter hemicellulosilyticusJCM 9152]
MNLKSVDLFSNEFHQNPYEYYEKIRPHKPFAKVKMFNEDQYSWMAFSYEAAEAVLKDKRFIKDMKTVYPDLTDENISPIAHSMLFSDPPNHRRLRRLAQNGFTPQKIAKLRGRIEEISKEQAILMKHNRAVDFIEDYAFPIPIRVICELLGIPTEDRLDFQRWSTVIVEITEAPRYEEAMDEFIAYLQKLIEQKRLDPQEDLLSELIQAKEEDEQLTLNELYGFVILLIVAGHETTVNLISNGLLALLTHPEQLALLKEDPSLSGKRLMNCYVLMVRLNLAQTVGQVSLLYLWVNK